MKTKRVAAVSIVALALSLMALVPLVAAYDHTVTMLMNVKPYSKDFTPPNDPNGNPNGPNTLLWIVYTSEGTTPFSGKDVATINAWYYTDYSGENPNWQQLAINQIHFKPDTITIVFSFNDVPADALGSYVEGTLANGETFIAYGPGWTYIHH